MSRPPIARREGLRRVTLYDSHCHLDFEAFDEDRDAVVSRAKRVGVEGFLVPGVSPSQWKKLPEIARRYPDARLATGIHPEWLGRLSEPEVRQGLEMLEAEAERLGAVAIGECGLDARHEGAPGADRQRQEEVLSRHLDAALALSLPVVLHIVRAHGRALALLEARGALLAGGVIHAYSGAAELIPRYAALGLSFGIGASITRPRAKRAREAARRVPVERLLLESDAPDSAPLGNPPRNEPASLPQVLEALASLRSETAEELARRSTENARALFNGEGRGAPSTATC